VRCGEASATPTNPLIAARERDFRQGAALDPSNGRGLGAYAEFLYVVLGRPEEGRSVKGDALRDYALKTGELSRAIAFIKLKFYLGDAPTEHLDVCNYGAAVYLSQLLAAAGQADQALALRRAAASWNDANEVKYLGGSRRLRAGVLLLDGKPDAALAEHGRVEDVLATVTQNFNRANAAVGEPEHGSFNLNHGAEVQLRGLGVGTTLTLVNGQRQGASGYQGTFTDVSTIPVSAIERIEILPEGSAALYGSDAIGGVVNIVLRKDFEGVEVRVRGSATDSDATERSAALLLGHAGSRGNVLAGVQFNDSDALRCSAREYCAANADLRRFGGTDLRNNFASNPGTILDPNTRAPTKISSVSAAVKGVLPKGWQINFTGAYSKASAELVETNDSLNYLAIDAALASSGPATALNIFGDGSHTNATVLAALRRQNITTDDLNVFTTASANVIADGPLLNWHAGVIRLAVGGEFRHEHSAGINISGNPEDRERLIRSGFFDLAVPMLGPPPSATVDRLDLSLAGRYDNYSDVGSTFNPKVGFSWRPLALIKLRGNWGTSFRAPPYFYSNHDQVGDAAIQNVIDPRAPTGYTPALLLYGPLPDLKPETGRAWTAGVDLTARTIPNLSLSVTYFDIRLPGQN
jgi:iron complex outermembrane receptor protein